MDAYQQAVEYLTEHRDRIDSAWFHPPIPSDEGVPGGCLFRFASKSGDATGSFGCLTAIRRNNGERCIEGRRDLTEALIADSRIPMSWEEIRPCHLPACAQWQRLIDKVLDREPPKMDPRIPLPTKEVEMLPLELEVACGR